MTKGARKTGGARRRLERGVPKRRRIGRPIKATLLIVGEGEQTEPNYFNGLKRDDAVDAKFAVTVKKGPGRSPERVVEDAIKHKNRAENRGEEYDEVWCVLDVEGSGTTPSLERAVAAANEHRIQLCLSNPCFEVWLLSHFERTAREFRHCDAVISQLNTHWRTHHKQDYRKNDTDLYRRVAPRTREALANAEWVRETHHAGSDRTADANSSTEVYRLVKKLVT